MFFNELEITLSKGLDVSKVNLHMSDIRNKAVIGNQLS